MPETSDVTFISASGDPLNISSTSNTTTRFPFFAGAACMTCPVKATVDCSRRS